MSAAAQYATLPRFGKVAFSTANTNRDGTGTLGVAFTATPTKNGISRIDKIVLNATGTTTAGMLRLFITKGTPGEVISSITFSGTTATVTTAQAHGRKTGDRVTMSGVLPDEYNVTDTALTITSPTQFTYAMASTPQNNALTSNLGGYSTTPTTPDTQLWREISVSAITPSATVQTFSSTASSQSGGDTGYLPLALPAGYSLRVSTHNAEAFVALVQGGDTA